MHLYFLSKEQFVSVILAATIVLSFWKKQQQQEKHKNKDFCFQSRLNNLSY